MLIRVNTFHTVLVFIISVYVIVHNAISLFRKATKYFNGNWCSLHLLWNRRWFTRLCGVTRNRQSSQIMPNINYHRKILQSSHQKSSGEICHSNLTITLGSICESFWILKWNMCIPLVGVVLTVEWSETYWHKPHIYSVIEWHFCYRSRLRGIDFKRCRML